MYLYKNYNKIVTGGLTQQTLHLLMAQGLINDRVIRS